MLDATVLVDKGVDGFRLDTINFCFADALLRDNPALPRSGATPRSRPV